MAWVSHHKAERVPFFPQKQIPASEPNLFERRCRYLLLHRPTAGGAGYSPTPRTLPPHPQATSSSAPGLPASPH